MIVLLRPPALASLRVRIQKRTGNGRRCVHLELEELDRGVQHDLEGRAEVAERQAGGVYGAFIEGQQRRHPHCLHSLERRSKADCQLQTRAHIVHLSTMHGME